MTDKTMISLIIDGKNSMVSKIPLKMTLKNARNEFKKKISPNAFFTLSNGDEIDTNDEEEFTIEDIVDNKRIYVKTQESSYLDSSNENKSTNLNSQSNLSEKEPMRGKKPLKNKNMKHEEEDFFLDDPKDFEEFKKALETTLSEKKRKNIPVKHSKLVKKGNPNIYLLPNKSLTANEELTAYSFLIVGQTGSGKTTLLNSFVNAIMDIKFEDDFRYIIVEEEKRSQSNSQTQNVQIYNIGPFPEKNLPVIRIIDTPGFGDTRGITQDQKITNDISNILKNKINTLKAICFVAKSSCSRLDHTQKYIFDSILKLFGKDIRENFIAMITFCDSGKPLILCSLEDKDSPFKNIIPYIEKPYYLEFNNSAFFEEKSDQNRFRILKMFWDMGEDSFKLFINKLKKLPTKSLKMTREVLKEREHLDTVIAELTPKIDECLNKMSEIKKKFDFIKSLKGKVKDNKSYEKTIPITEEVKEKVPDGVYTTTCPSCHYTCHHNCLFPDNNDKMKCSSMNENGYCDVCPQKCYWNIHYNYGYYYKSITKNKIITYDEMKKEYFNSTKKLDVEQQIINGLKIDYIKKEDECLKIIEEVKKSLDQLKKIALNANSYTSTRDYIDILIAGIESEKKDNWKEKVKGLKKMQKQYDNITLLFNKKDLKEKTEFEKFKNDYLQDKIKRIDLNVTTVSGFDSDSEFF